MTRQKSFKRLVRTRMEKTGESYTAARAMLLAADTPEPVLTAPDARIRERTGLGWEEWFDRLDAWGAAGRPHREISRWVADQLGIEPLAWPVQAVTVGYERARGGRAVGQHEDGFAVTATRTVAVPVEVLFDAFAGSAPPELRERTATRPRSARFDWGDDGTRVSVTFAAKDDGRSVVALEHSRLPGPGPAEQRKAFWREHLASLKARLEASDA
jgi:hypothetical protein